MSASKAGVDRTGADRTGADPASPSSVGPWHLIEQDLGSALGIVMPSGTSRGPCCRKLSDETVLDSLTNIKRCSSTYKRTVKEMTLNAVGLLGTRQKGFCNVEGFCNVTTVLHLPGAEGAQWTEQQEQAYVQSVLKGLTKPHFQVNVIRGQGRLVSGSLRIKALRKWLWNELPVLVNGQEVFRQQLPDQDQNFFGQHPVYWTVFQDLTKADEIEVLQMLACAGWQ